MATIDVVGLVVWAISLFGAAIGGYALVRSVATVLRSALERPTSEKDIKAFLSVEVCFSPTVKASDEERHHHRYAIRMHRNTVRG